MKVGYELPGRQVGWGWEGRGEAAEPHQVAGGKQGCLGEIPLRLLFLPLFYACYNRGRRSMEGGGRENGRV